MGEFPCFEQVPPPFLFKPSTGFRVGRGEEEAKHTCNHKRVKIPYLFGTRRC